jgi:hypothetical protein
MPSDNERIFVMLVGQLQNVPQLRVSDDGQSHAVGTFVVHEGGDRWFRLLFFGGHAERIATIGKRGVWLDVHGWIINRLSKEITVERFRVLTA